MDATSVSEGLVRRRKAQDVGNDIVRVNVTASTDV